MKFLRKKPMPIDTSRRRVSSSSRQTPVFSYYTGNRQKRSSQQPESSPPRTNRLRHSQGTQTSSPRLRRHWHFEIRNIPTYIAVLMLGTAFVYVFSLSNNPRVVIEQEPGVVQRKSQVYQTEIQRLWQKSVLHRSKLTVGTQRIRQTILENYPELSDVRVQLPLVGHRATIVLVPALPSLQIQAQNGTFYVDAKGKALVDTSFVSTSRSVPTIAEDSVLTVEPGQAVLPQSQVLFILQLITELDMAHVNMESITLSNKAVNQLDVRITGLKYYIKVQADGSVDARQVVGTLLASRKKLESQGITSGEYLDLRVSEKAFYR